MVIYNISTGRNHIFQIIEELQEYFDENFQRNKSENDTKLIIPFLRRECEFHILCRIPLYSFVLWLFSKRPAIGDPFSFLIFGKESICQHRECLEVNCEYLIKNYQKLRFSGVSNIPYDSNERRETGNFIVENIPVIRMLGSI